MKKFLKLTSLLLLISVIVGCLASCDLIFPPEQPEDEHVDYAASVELDMSSASAKTEIIEVNLYVDGDTTHFKVEGGIVDNVDNVLKARYISINTPESTGKIEEWGNDAARFTKEKLEGADSIILESDTDDGKWNNDSTGERKVVWVWYRTAGSNTYRNLNIEILQNGLAFASNSANNRYGDVCMKALAQARREKLFIFSNDIDPDFPYGDPTPMLLRDIRMNIEDHYYMNVYFEGNIIWDDGGTIYVEEYDEETGMYHGITAYYGWSLNGDGLAAIRVGNRIRLVGVITYFEGGDIWQVSDLYYDPFNPDDARCLEVIEEGGKSAAYPLTDVSTFLGDKTVTVNGKTETYKYAELALNASIRMEGLTVERIYTTNNGGDNDGAMTLTCKKDGKTITVRTNVLYDNNGQLIKAKDFEGKTINVNGVVEKYNGSYQIKLFSMQNVEFVD
ncbi:MAG: thermonuclease family protein [Clostridia bacterium]|nr:thermonuclease family protein [Clostridia bacterium]